MRKLRVLVAEDNSVNQLFIKMMLGRLGHFVDVVANGAEAVEAVKRVPYDLVLMDIQMPEMDGWPDCHKGHSTARSTALPHSHHCIDRERDAGPTRGISRCGDG